uniref:Peptidyl-prolyl cis-trans isomerase n=1 Tax=Ganoderma boninense TaxID=34458 RepID=A0A5K1JYD6_9APHY|nr:HC-toxin synthetase (HTS) (EC [Ganoderma boninense]
MANWEIRLSSSRGVVYYYNKDTKESVWDPPADLTQEEIKALPGAQYLNRPPQVRASHLLVKHRDSRRPSSWKEPEITRTKDEAIKILSGYRDEIGSSAQKFGELAELHSDCSSHSHRGDLGYFKPGQMQKPFEDATYALQVDEISDIISTDSGVHIILRTA